jgi:hypothetical protein
MVVVFALMTHSQHRNRFRILDFEQGDVTGRAERDNKFSQEGIPGGSLAAAEGRGLEQGNAVANGIQRARRNGPVCVVSLQDEVV